MATPTESAPKGRARRGDGGVLRARILTEAERLLVEAGSAEGVSIRTLAARCEVTAPSIYLHFPDKKTLLARVCEGRFHELDALMAAATRDAADPLDEVRRQGIAYVRFGLAHPEVFRQVMLGRPDDPSEPLRNEPFEHIPATVRKAIAAGALPDADPDLATRALWAGIHGLAVVLTSGPRRGGGDDETIDYMLDVLIEGVLST